MNRLYLFILTAYAGIMLSSCARPVANFIPTPSEDMAPAAISFSNESKNATTYHWDFGDGNQSNDMSPTHEYLQSGNYEVTLIAQNEKGKENIKKTRIMITAPKKCLVEIQTEFGNMVVELYDDTPKHRDNFYKLADEGFYNGLLFHRVINGFMIQGGDPLSKEEKPSQPVGTGGPGYQIPAEINPDFIHVKGALAAARQPDNVNPSRQSSGSQFYIVHGNQLTEDELKSIERRTGVVYSSQQKDDYIEHGGYPMLDGNYTVFGRVVSGLDVIDKIVAVPKNSRNLPDEEVKMKMITIK